MERIKEALRRRGLLKWLPLIVLSSALMIIILDTTVLNVSIRVMVNELNTDVKGIQWVISAYSLTLAALTVTGGRMGDLFGRKKMFKLGAVLFAFGSLVTSLAPNIAWVIIGNALMEGVGAALMMPATASLLVHHYHGRDRALAFAIWGTVASVAASLGPIIGGWLTTYYSWRWAFRINLFVVALLLIGAKYIIEAKNETEKNQMDYPGVVLSGLGLVALVYGLIESSSYGWLFAKKTFEVAGQSIIPFGLSVTPVAILLGVAFLSLFVMHERRREAKGQTPLVNLGIFKNRQFTSGSATVAMLAIGQTGMIFALPIFFQSVRGLDALHTGYSIVPTSLGIMIGAPLGLQLLRWMTPKRVIQTGFVVSFIGVLYLFLTINVDATTWVLGPGQLIYGLGAGFGFSQLGNLTLSAVSEEQSGEASGVNNTLRQIGASFGSAIIGAILISTMMTGVVNRVSENPNIPSESKPVILEAVSSAGSNVEFGGLHLPDSVPTGVAEEITKDVHAATTDGSKMALGVMAGFVLLALGVSNFLPNIKNLETAKPIASAH